MTFYNKAELGPIRNIAEADYEQYKDLPVYQILKLEYALSLIIGKKLRFGNIWESWEDPYELFMYKQDVSLNGHYLSDSLLRLAKATYGQCWSVVEDTDAMWRIYSPNKRSVQIKTTFGKLMKLMDNTRGMTHIKNGKVLHIYIPYFGRVLYMPQDDIDDAIKKTSGLNTFEYFMKCGESLFIKRQEFAHENEVRFVIAKSNFTADETDNIDEAIYMDIDPLEFIDEIKIDPRTSNELYQEIKASIDATLSGLNITKSSLYAFNRNKIELANTPVILKI